MVDLPQRRPGHWRIRMATTAPVSSDTQAQHCTDAQTERAMTEALAAQGRMCRRYEMRREGEALIIEPYLSRTKVFSPAVTRPGRRFSGGDSGQTQRGE